MIIAGGYDSLNPENIHHYVELCGLAENLHLTRHVTFLKSPDSELKKALLYNCTALLYTPTKEHFGIVPVEAMYCRRPVIATDTGGPLESVVDRTTGFLLPSDSEKFAEAMKFFLDQKQKIDEFGKAGRERAEELFSFKVFTEKLNDLCVNLCQVSGE